MDELRKIYGLLRKSDSSQALTLVNILENQKVLFFKVGELTASKLASTYETRLNIARDQGNWPETWANWSKVVHDLQKLDDKIISGISIITNQHHHFIFTNQAFNELHGMLRIPNAATINESIESNDKMIAEGLSVSQVLYDRLNLIKRWR